MEQSELGDNINTCNRSILIVSYMFLFSDSPMDLKIKSNLLTDMFNLTGNNNTVVQPDQFSSN